MRVGATARIVMQRTGAGARATRLWCEGLEAKPCAQCLCILRRGGGGRWADSSVDVANRQSCRHRGQNVHVRWCAQQQQQGITAASQQRLLWEQLLKQVRKVVAAVAFLQHQKGLKPNSGADLEHLPKTPGAPHGVPFTQVQLQAPARYVLAVEGGHLSRKCRYPVRSAGPRFKGQECRSQATIAGLMDIYLGRDALGMLALRARAHVS